MNFNAKTDNPGGILLEAGYFVVFNQNANSVAYVTGYMKSTLEPSPSSSKHVVCVKMMLMG
jgi:hypothetical protein